MEEARCLETPVAVLASGGFCRCPPHVHRFHLGAGPPTCCRGTKKTAATKLWDARGGLTTKIHAACVDEISSVGLVLSPGQNADCARFEELFASLDADNVLEVAALDKGYESNAIHERLARDGINAVIPPKSNRKDKIPYDADVYRQRNRVSASSTGSSTSGGSPRATRNMPARSSQWSTSVPHSSISGEFINTTYSFLPILGL